MCLFFNENCCIFIKFSLKYVCKGPIDNKSALVQIMALRWSGDKPLSEPMMISLPTHICITRPQWVKGFPHTTLENSGKLPFHGKSGKSQGICQAPQGILENRKSSGNSQGIFGYGRFRCHFWECYKVFHIICPQFLNLHRVWKHINVSVQDSSVLAMESPQPCTKPLIYLFSEYKRHLIFL